MLRVPSQFRITVLHSPYDYWKDPVVQSMFPKIMDLKIQGYGKEYPYGVMPIDTYDFIASHIVVHQEGDPLPVMAYKSVTLEKAKAHHLPFPAQALLKSSPSETQPHQDLLAAILRRCEAENIPISYDSSWTIQPKMRENREVTSMLRDLMMAMMIHFHRENGIREQIGAGVLRFKTHQYFQNFGYRLFSQGEQPLPELELASLWNEKILLMHCKGYSPKALELAESMRSLWEDRFEIGKQLKKAA